MSELEDVDRRLFHTFSLRSHSKITGEVGSNLTVSVKIIYFVNHFVLYFFEMKGLLYNAYILILSSTYRRNPTVNSVRNKKFDNSLVHGLVTTSFVVQEFHTPTPGGRSLSGGFEPLLQFYRSGVFPARPCLGKPLLKSLDVQIIRGFI